MTKDELYAQSSLFFIAGYETTASLLRYTSYLLATHTDVQDRLVDEINEQLGNVSLILCLIIFFLILKWKR